MLPIYSAYLQWQNKTLAIFVWLNNFFISKRNPGTHGTYVPDYIYTRPESRAGYPVCITIPTANVLGESISLNVDKTENSCRVSSLLSNQDSRFTWVFIPMSKEISADSHMALLFSVILTRVDLTITNQKVCPYWNRVESFWWIKCSIWIKILWNFHSVIFCRQTWFEIWFGLQPFL